MSTIDRSLKTGRITIIRQLSKHNTPRMNVRRADPSRTICLIPSQGAEKLERAGEDRECHQRVSIMSNGNGRQREFGLKLGD